MQILPDISIIIVSLNSQRTLKSCLQYIEQQTYPHVKEVLLIDGGSSDNSIEIAKEAHLPIKIVNGRFKNNQEARRAIGIARAKSKICAMIDSDNYIIDKNWLKAMVEPLMDNTSVVASQTLRYAVPKGASSLNRYFGLLGGADPVSYYLKKSDRLSWAFDHWNLLGKVLLRKRNYFIVEFDPNNFPTVGANGIVFKKSKLLRSNWGNPDNFFHTDVYVDIAKKGMNRFAIVNNEIFHNTADTIFTFFQKRKKYMEIHYQKLSTSRRYVVFDPKNTLDVRRLLLFIFYSVTLVEPLFEAIRGYLKKRDSAWFLHPFISLGIAIVYFYSTIAGLFYLALNKEKS